MLLVEEGGADLSAADRWGATPLAEAKRVGAAEVIAYLNSSATAKAAAATRVRVSAAAKSSRYGRGSGDGANAGADADAAGGDSSTQAGPSSRTSATGILRHLTGL